MFYNHCVPDHLVNPGLLEQTETDRQDDHHNLQGEHQDDYQQDEGHLGGGQSIQLVETALGEVGVVVSWHSGTLGVVWDKVGWVGQG